VVAKQVLGLNLVVIVLSISYKLKPKPRMEFRCVPTAQECDLASNRRYLGMNSFDLVKAIAVL